MADEHMAQLDATEADVDIYEAVVEAVEDLNMVRESRVPITIGVDRGVVSLSGVVLSSIMHRGVLYRAATAPGVIKVIDHLVEDPGLRVAVAGALAADPTVGPLQPSIAIVCYMGTVTITGPALPADIRQKVKEIAENVPGVRGVVTEFAER